MEAAVLAVEGGRGLLLVETLPPVGLEQARPELFARGRPEALRPVLLPAGFGCSLASAAGLYVAVRGIGRGAARSHVHIADSVAMPKPVR